MLVEDYFEKEIWIECHDSDQYKSVRLILFNVLETFTNTLPWFKTLSKQKRYDICYEAAMIALDTQREQINNFEVLTKKEDKFFKKSINRPNKKYELLTLNTSDNNKNNTKIITIDYEP